MTLLLEKLIGDDFGYSYTGKWGKATRHDSLVVDRESGMWFWNSKDLRGKVREYLLLVRNYSQEQANEVLKQENKSESFSVNQDSPSTPYEKLVEYCWQEGKDKRDYWYRRGLDDSTIDRFKLGYFNEWSVIPIYVDGEFRNFQCRKDTPEKIIRPWYRGVGPLLCNSDILKFVSSVFITEGPVDAIKLNQEGFTAISHTSGATGWQQDWVKYFFRVKDIVYVADNDEAGEAGASKVAKSLGEGRVRILRFAGKPEKFDSIDFFRESGTVEEFKELVKQSRYLYEGVG